MGEKTLYNTNIIAKNINYYFKGSETIV